MKTHENLISKFILGTALISTSLSGCSECKDKEQNVGVIAEMSNEQEHSIDRSKYIVEEKRTPRVLDPNNPTVYIVYQSHNIDYLSIDYDDELKEGIRNSQISVYRVLERLNKSKGVQLVLNEGVRYDDFSDIDDPDFYQEKDPSKKDNYELFKRRLKTDDQFLGDVLIKNEVSAGSYVCLINPELFLMGYEEEGKNKELVKMVQKMFTNPKEFTKDEVENYVRLQVERTFDALKYGFSGSELLYKREMISKRDFAVVIGRSSLHSRPFDKISEYINSEWGFNVVQVYTEGLEKKVEEQ
tara:strand:+ start:1199 stop:2095 length:897 start_codon:yes stop_codon:yes gene_type:complete